MVSFALQTLQKTKLYTLPLVFTVQVQRRYKSSTPQPTLPLPNVSNFGGCITAPGPFLETSFFLHALIPLMISPSPTTLDMLSKQWCPDFHLQLRHPPDLQMPVRCNASPAAHLRVEQTSKCHHKAESSSPKYLLDPQPSESHLGFSFLRRITS